MNLSNNAYSIDHSNMEYVVKQYFVEGSGVRADSQQAKINYDKITEEDKIDGYFCIITSELK